SIKALDMQFSYPVNHERILPFRLPDGANRFRTGWGKQEVSITQVMYANHGQGCGSTRSGCNARMSGLSIHAANITFSLCAKWGRRCIAIWGDYGDRPTGYVILKP
ncbi:MAG: hypothetical protein QF530_13720, partial [SAR202 cluster bacterium]|nr:hypothetical protein [SAR202 cluster bacterium]